MSITPTQLDYDRAIRAYVKLATSLPYVIQANANFPVPTGDYATALLINDSKQGFDISNDDYNEINDNFDSKTYSNHLMQYSIQIYRASNALELARQLSLFFGTPDGRHHLQTNNLVLLDWSEVRNLDSVIDGQFERRSSIDLTFGMITTYEQTLERIASVDIDVSLQDSQILTDQTSITEE